MIVAKFGGTVLNGSEGVLRACNEIRSLARPLLVVVSAFANVTNRLERLAESAAVDPSDARRQLEEIVGHHREIARQVLSPGAFDRWEEEVSPLVERLGEVVRGLGIVRELSPRTLDLVVHFGERFSSSIVLAALNDAHLEDGAVAIPALDLIITDTSHRYARPDVELTRERVESKLLPALHEHGVVVTEGYIARSTAGEATTMGRESSDFSASLLAEMLRADEVRIHTDVPGILTADPTLVPEARTLPRLSYSMARTLAELGAKVLHPRTVTPVERGNIPLVIRRIDGAGTTICSAGESDSYSVVLLPGAGVITIETTTTSALTDPFLRAVSERVPVIWHHHFRRRLQVVTAQPYPRPELPTELIGERVYVVASESSVVSLVREGGLEGPDLERFFATLGDRAPIAVQGGIDRHSISAAVPHEQAMAAVHSLHRLFIER
jgi:aspartate kinase